MDEWRKIDADIGLEGGQTQLVSETGVAKPYREVLETHLHVGIKPHLVQPFYDIHL